MTDTIDEQDDLPTYPWPVEGRKPWTLRVMGPGSEDPKRARFIIDADNQIIGSISFIRAIHLREFETILKEIK